MTEPSESAYERAQKRVAKVRDFYGHLAVYVVVMALLVTIDLLDDDPGNTSQFLGLDWAYWPLFGWGIFVLIQAVTVFGFGTKWQDRKFQKYLEEEQSRMIE